MELDLTNKKISRLVGAPFWYLALYTGVPLTNKDLDYLLNTIKKHPCFELVDSSRRIDLLSCSNLEIANIKINQIVFYDIFYNDPQCPSGIKSVLFTFLGILRYEAEDFCSGLLEFRYEYVKKWVASIIEKSLIKSHC